MGTVGRAIRMSQARPEMSVPSVMARSAAIFRMKKLTAICSAMTVSESVTRTSSVSLFGLM